MTIFEQFKQSCNIKKSLSLYGKEAKCWEARQKAYKQLISLIGMANMLSLSTKNLSNLFWIKQRAIS